MNWTNEFLGSVTVCDCEGIVVYMNERSKEQFAKNDDGDLVGKSLIDCHPEPARTLLKKMLAEPVPNSYTIEKKGIHKMIHQTPWMENGEFRGVVEISFEIPMDMPHHVRS
ncbi:MAG: PAS domain-containing protein [Bacteroidota bacterium]|nr:PAS domain-containing protein [Bacteroidota bacterium]